MKMLLRTPLLVLLLCAMGCSGTETTPTFSREQLMDPNTCQGCHPHHFQEWASSMHAYASADPIFVAMNKRGQREAKLGTFCVKCHAPMAVSEGYTKDGLNLKDAPAALRGVTCYFCHNAEEINGTHNNPIKLANDTVMRGGIRDPKSPGVHGVAYSQLHDGDRLESAKLCGSCHDIVTPDGVHLERTYSEWQNSVFSHARGLSCNGCHMDQVYTVAADDPKVKVPQRFVHTHLFAAVDTALTKFPDPELQRKAVECALKPAVLVTLCPSPAPLVQPVSVSLETSAGHRFPSGASQDRRLWVEVTAYDKDGKVIHDSGKVEDGTKIIDKKTAGDPDPWLFRDQQYDKNGNEALMFWEAVPHDPDPSTVTCSNTLPETKTLVPGSHSCTKEYRAVPAAPPADRVRVQVHLQPVASEVLDSLVKSGDLDPAIAKKMPTFTLADSITEWHAADGPQDCVVTSVTNSLDCPNDYLCIVYPDLEGCAGKAAGAGSAGGAGSTGGN